MDMFNPQDVTKLIYEVSDEIIRPNFNNPDNRIYDKTGPEDIQTDADMASERFLKQGLSRIYPKALFLGEEECFESPDLIENLLNQDEKPVWIVDPIDGTRNFARGKAVFAVIIALVERKRPAYGWIYDVPGNRMVLAQKGKGTYLNNTRIQFPDTPPGDDELKGYALRTKRLKAIEKNHGPFNLKSLGCSGHEYINLVEGKRHFSINKNIMPWDHAAGALMIEEAGGLAKHWDGEDFYPYKTKNGLISACHKDIMDKLRPLLL